MLDQKKAKIIFEQHVDQITLDMDNADLFAFFLQFTSNSAVADLCVAMANTAQQNMELDMEEDEYDEDPR